MKKSVFIRNKIISLKDFHGILTRLSSSFNWQSLVQIGETNREKIKKKIFFSLKLLKHPDQKKCLIFHIA